MIVLSMMDFKEFKRHYTTKDRKRILKFVLNDQIRNVILRKRLTHRNFEIACSHVFLGRQQKKIGEDWGICPFRIRTILDHAAYTALKIHRNLAQYLEWYPEAMPNDPWWLRRSVKNPSIP